MHGIFDRQEISTGFIASLLGAKGMGPDTVKAQDLAAYKEEQYDKLAELMRESLDMDAVYDILEKGNEASCSL